MDIKNLTNTLDRAQQERWERLDLSSQQLEVLPEKLFELSSLSFLNLSNNKIKTVPSKIKKLTKLTTLILSKNLLTDVPVEIGDLKYLEYLNLSFNSLVILPVEIGVLKHLRVLDASYNSFYNFPSEICGLVDLSEIDFQKNNISYIPRNISNLTKLKKVNLSNNNISELPVEIKDLVEQQNLEILIRENPFSIPPEILNKGDSGAIISYYFSNFETTKRAINEVKVNVVGQGSVGKTSIIQRLLNDAFSYNELKTDGISISQLEVDNLQKTNLLTNKLDNQKIKIRLNMWDYGGQEIMHATHQFFLTKRSLYLLVLDARLTQEENRVEYWLKIIQSFGGDSPVLIVGNKTDQHPLDIDRVGLQKKYPNIVDIVETSAATGSGIDKLKDSVVQQVNNLPHVRDLLPETWFVVKTELESLGQKSNFITQDKFLDICAENGVTDEISQHTLLGLLHDLGIILHFQDDPRLETLGILNPQWVTNGVYKILNSYVLFQNKGVLTLAMLDQILNLIEYPRSRRLFIVDMMKKFELCYDIESDKTFLVPDLLPKDEPRNLVFNGLSVFEYLYPVLPSSIITRFIVRFNKNIQEGIVWRTGVVLKIGENTALVKADIEDRRITIAIDGTEHTRRDALSAIRYQLDEIHNTIQGLNPQKRIPIPNASNAEPVEYEYLLMLEREGIETFAVKDGNNLLKLDVRQILSGVDSDMLRRNLNGNVTNIYVGGNVQGEIVTGVEKSQLGEQQAPVEHETITLWNSIKSALIEEDANEFYIQSNSLIRLLCRTTLIRTTIENKGIDHVYGVLADANDTMRQLRIQKQFPVVVVDNVTKQSREVVENINNFIQEIDGDREFEDTTAIPFGIFIFINEVQYKEDLLENIYLENVVILSKDTFETVVNSSLPHKTFVEEIIQQVGLAKLNPYVYSGPAPDRIFYGRDEEQKTVEGKIISSNYAVVANRRMGKTSFLFRISDKLRAPYKDNIVVNLDLQHVFTYTEFYQQLLNQVPKYQEVQIPAENEIPNYISLNLINILRTKQSAGRIIVIMDEVDELLHYDCTNKEKLFRAFRSLSQTQNIRFIFSGTTILVDRLNSPESPFFNFCEEIIIGQLAPAPSEALITEPISKLGVRFFDQTKVVQEILRFTSRHPTLIQYLCAKLVDKIFREKKTAISSADLSSILETQSYIDDIFKVIWGDISSDEKLIIYLTWNLDSFSKLKLMQLLASENLKLANLDNSLKRLLYYSLLSSEGDSYRFSYKAFARYYESFHNINELLEIEKLEG